MRVNRARRKGDPLLFIGACPLQGQRRSDVLSDMSSQVLRVTLGLLCDQESDAITRHALPLPNVARVAQAVVDLQAEREARVGMALDEVLAKAVAIPQPRLNRALQQLRAAGVDTSEASVVVHPTPYCFHGVAQHAEQLDPRRQP